MKSEKVSKLTDLCNNDILFLLRLEENMSINDYKCEIKNVKLEEIQEKGDL